jgi:hypothetical protein
LVLVPTQTPSNMTASSAGKPLWVGVRPDAGPTAFNHAVTVSYDTSLSIALTAVSLSCLPLTYSVVSGPAHGTLSGIGPNLTYTPISSYTGSDVFIFRANDGTADSNAARVTITVCEPNHQKQRLSGIEQNWPNSEYTGDGVFTFKVNDDTADGNMATEGVTVVSASQLMEDVGGQGYINGTPLTSHTTAAFNSVGVSTLVIFVSTNSPWNGQSVSISGVSDNLGNSWSVLTGPTLWNGNQYSLLSGIYYVNAPATSNVHTVTVRLINPAPLVMDVFAISGAAIKEV